MGKMTKVLIVDDSALMRRLLGSVLQAHFEVQAARNGVEAIERLLEWQPDVVTLDVNMPEMDGLTALSLIMQARPTPVVMVSSLTAKGAQTTVEALALGAVDFIAKPGGTISLNIEDIAEQLLQKVKVAARSRLHRRSASTALTRQVEPEPTRSPRAPLRSPRTSVVSPPAPPSATAAVSRRPAPLKTSPSSSTAPPASALPGLVLIGVSTGGPRTLEDILPALDADFPWPVLIAQHMPANFTRAFAERLDKICPLTVCEVDSTTAIKPGHIYIAHGDADMVVAERLGRLVAQTRPETPGHPWHPSVDVLVNSALQLMPARQLIGVQLTGMGFDGADAMAQIKARGGRTIAESQETCVVFGMPAELIERGGASVVLPCQDIAAQLCAWTQTSAPEASPGRSAQGVAS